MISIDFDGSGLDGEIDNLDIAISGAIRPSAQAAAEIFYREVLGRVPVSEGPHLIRTKGGIERVIQPGALSRSIYQAFAEKQSKPVGANYSNAANEKSAQNSGSVKGYLFATYRVSWNSQKAPHGHLVEWGHIQTRVTYLGDDGRWHTGKKLLETPRHVAARPFLRPAYHAAAARAMAAADTEIDRRVAPACAA